MKYFILDLSNFRIRPILHGRLHNIFSIGIKIRFSFRFSCDFNSLGVPFLSNLVVSTTVIFYSNLKGVTEMKYLSMEKLQPSNETYRIVFVTKYFINSSLPMTLYFEAVFPCTSGLPAYGRPQ